MIEKKAKLSLRHKVKREWYLFKLDNALEVRLGGRERRRIVRELRTIIDADAGEDGLLAVLQNLASILHEVGNLVDQG